MMSITPVASLEAGLELLRSCPLKCLEDEWFLETSLLPVLGFNDEVLYEFPTPLHEYCGKGLRSWQYPNQFAPFLRFLTTRNVNRYVEIGCRWGGTFIIVVEYLRRFGMAAEAVAIDPWPTEQLLAYVEQTPGISCTAASSHSDDVQQFLHDNPFDLAFIDGDHSYAGARLDYESVKHMRTVALHDIINANTPGVQRLWKEIRQRAGRDVELLQFVKQYPEVIERRGDTYLSIGVVMHDG
jgi:hypothetical protein